MSLYKNNVNFFKGHVYKCPRNILLFSVSKALVATTQLNKL